MIIFCEYCGLDFQVLNQHLSYKKLIFIKKILFNAIFYSPKKSKIFKQSQDNQKFGIKSIFMLEF